MRHWKTAFGCALCLGLLGGVPQAQGALSLISSRAALAGDDFIDWGQLGPSGTSVPNPFTAVSNGGLQFQGTIPNGLLQTRVQNYGWNGNFAPGDNLLWTGGLDHPGPLGLTLNFGLPLYGAGAQIQDDWLGSFTATIEAFDSGNNSLGMFTVGGYSSSAGDNSAIFVGVLSDTPNIAKIAFNVTTVHYGMTTTDDFAINQMDLVTIPAPGAVLLGAIGLTMAGWVKKRLS